MIVPAAGAGRRVAGEVPKQYLRLAGRTVMEWSLAPFLARNDIAGVVVTLASNDEHFASLSIARNPRVRTAVGGAERSDSVRNGLDALLDALGVDAKDWVLVHDAARPCLHEDDLARLIDELRDDDVGGLLAAPVADTLKAGDSAQRVVGTPQRDILWRALTPQMFRYELLARGLRTAAGKTITDESSAIELLGLKPRLVRGRSDNIKITVPEDVPHAEFILRQRIA